MHFVRHQARRYLIPVTEDLQIIPTAPERYLVKTLAFALCRISRVFLLLDVLSPNSLAYLILSAEIQVMLLCLGEFPMYASK